MSEEELTEDDLEQLWKEARTNWQQLDQAWLDYRMNDLTIEEIYEKYELENEEEHK